MACDSLRVMCHEICGLQRGDRPRTVDRIKAHSQNGDIQFHSISAEEKRNLWLIMATRRAVAPETRGMISGLSYVIIRLSQQSLAPCTYSLEWNSRFAMGLERPPARFNWRVVSNIAQQLQCPNWLSICDRNAELGTHELIVRIRRLCLTFRTVVYVGAHSYLRILLKRSEIGSNRRPESRPTVRSQEASCR